jgi:hypothetical protein
MKVESEDDDDDDGYLDVGHNSKTWWHNIS